MPLSNRDANRADVSSYFDAIGRVARLSAAEERALAQELVHRRCAYWSMVLASDAHRKAALEVVAEHCDDGEILRARGLARPSAAELDALAQRLAMADPGESCTAAIQRLASACDPEWARSIRAARRSYLVVRDRFVSANLRLVILFAKRYGRAHAELADRIQEGNLGLLKAVERFDPARGLRFSTYAGWWIRHTITRALTDRARTVRIPSHLQSMFTKARRARPHLAVQLGRDPTYQELAGAIDVDPDRLEKAELAMHLQVVSLDVPTGDNGDRLGDELVDETLPEPLSGRDQLRLQLRAASALRELPAKDRDILQQRFALDGNPPKTLAEIGDQLGLSRERIRQLQNKALSKLRGAMDDSLDTRAA